MFNKYSRINSKLIARITGFLLIIIGIFMSIPFFVSVYFKEKEWIPMGISVLFCFGIGFFLRNILGRNAQYRIHQREGFITVGVIWVIIPLISCTPYLFCGAVPHFTDAFFESMSGFTTTGATIIPDVTSLPKGLLIWRSLTQWLGGLGLILFSIVLLRRLKERANILFSAEFADLVHEKLHPKRARSTLRIWIVYLIITLSMFVFLLLMGNTPLHSICLSLSTVSSGGFSPVNENLSYFSQGTQSIVMVYMFFSGINITLLYYLFTLKPKKIIRDEEFQWYLKIVFFFSLLILYVLLLEYNFSWGDALKNGVFLTLSTISTSGYYLDDIPYQSFSILLIIFVLMFIGGCSNSMTGSIKISRIVTLFKFIKTQIKKVMHPYAVIPVKFNKQRIMPDNINRIFTFCFLYFIFFIVGTMILSLCGIELTNSVSMSASIIGNIGPAIGNLCPTCSYIELPKVAKWSLSVIMLAGRLEIFALIALFSPQFWKK